MLPSMSNASPDPLIDSPPDNFQLAEIDGLLALVDRTHPRRSPVTVEFPSHLVSARGRSELAAQPLVRAMGKKPRDIVDATAGMGQDSIALAVFGFQVTAYERSGTIAALLQNGVQRMQQDRELGALLGDRLQVIQGDSIQTLPRLQSPPQVIYLDPMYPPKRRKSALAKKEIQLLRALVGDDMDATLLYQTAMRCAGDRVVVKRPHYAEPIADRPDMSYEGKLVRFDVYLTGPGRAEPR